MSGSVRAVTRPQTLPLAPEQRALDAGAVALAVVVRIMGPLDEARLRRALRTVASSHEILQTAFVGVPGVKGLRALPLDAPADVAWIVRDLRGRPAETDVEHDFDALRTTPFDLASGETLRAALWRLGNEDRRLTLVASPLVADGGGLELIRRDLQATYASDGSGAGPSEETSYGRYAEWCLEMAADEDAEQGRAYWRQHLSGTEALPPLRLPYRRDTGMFGKDCNIAHADLSATMATRLADLAEKHATSVETVLQAAWWALLCRLTGQSEFVGAWRHDCRRDYDVFAGTIGRFEKSLPVHLSLDPAEAFTAWLARVEQCLDDHRGWQEHVGADLLAKESRPAIGFGLAPPQAADALAGWEFEAIALHDEFEIELRPQFASDGRLIGLAIVYDTACYPERAARTLLEQMTTLCSLLPDAAQLPIYAISPIGADERGRLLRFDRADARPPGYELPLAAILRFGRETPAAPALEGSAGRLDYAALTERADRLARWLRSRNVGPEAIVALDMPRGIDTIVAMLAVWRAGGAYLPLDPAWPLARRRALCNIAQVALVLRATADGDLGATAPSHDFTEAMTALDVAVDLPDPAGGAEHAAYVVFTSGSTGTPKGVVIEHRHLANYVAGARTALGFGDCKRFALTSTVAADLGNTVLFGALTGGACLIVADEDVARDPHLFAEFVRNQAIDCVKLAPTHLAAILQTDQPAVPSMLILGGEATTAGLVERVLAVDPRCRIRNHYGPTEGTVGVLVHVHDGRPSQTGLPLTQTLDGNAVYVLDAHGQLAPTGALGELHIGGAQLCRGYLGEDGRARAADFRPAHHDADAGWQPTVRRLYPTGDLARYRLDGGIDIVGRADQQVKIRGYRVEPAEVEALLSSLSGVRRAAVVARPAAGERDASLLAFVTSDDIVDAAALRVRLAERLPEPMLPARIVVLAAFPLLPNGKIDLARLPLEDIGAPAAAAPRDALETLLRDMAADLLGRPAESIGVGDDFFGLGGNSLLVIRFVARIRKLLDVDVPPAIVFDHADITGLATALRAHATGDRLDRTAALRLKLAALPDAERAALLKRAAG